LGQSNISFLPLDSFKNPKMPVIPSPPEGGVGAQDN